MKNKRKNIYYNKNITIILYNCMANKDNHIFTFIKEDADDEEVDDVKEVKKVKKDKKDEEYELSPDNKSDYQTKSKKFTTKNIPYGSIYDPELKSPVFLKKVNKPLYKRKSIKDIKKEINCLGDLYFKDGQRFYLVKHDKIPEKVNTVLCINDNDANNYYKNNDSTDKSKWIISEIEKQDNINYIKTKYKDLENPNSYVFRMVSNVCIDKLRIRKNIEQKTENYFHNISNENGIDSSSRIIEKEEYKRISEILSKIPSQPEDKQKHLKEQVAQLEIHIQKFN